MLMLYMIEKMTTTCRALMWTDLQSPPRRFTYLDQVCWAGMGKGAHTTITPLVEKYLREIIDAKDFGWLTDIIEWEVTVAGVELGFEVGNRRFALGVLESILHQLPVEDDALDRAVDVHNSIIEVLARMRVSYPDEVDDFMAINNLNDDFRLQVRTREPSETIGDLLSMRSFRFFIEAFIKRGSKEDWRTIIWMFEQLPKYWSLDQWLALLVSPQ